MGKIIDEIGNHYNRLTVIEFSEVKDGRAVWKCKCDCGNEFFVNSHNLRNGYTKSCGCLKQERSEKLKENCIDMKGLRFGRLLVIEKCNEYHHEGKDRKPRIQWRCICDCGEEVIVTGKSLRSGNTQSCGWLNKEITGQMLRKKLKRYNTYEIKNDYVIMYTLKGEPFYVDLEDFNKVKEICWCIDWQGYVVGKENGKHIRIHDIVMNFIPNKDSAVDHIGGELTRNDNRKRNLRIVTSSQNAMNRKLRSDNTSGYTGVSWNKIKINGFHIYALMVKISY